MGKRESGEKEKIIFLSPLFHLYLFLHFSFSLLVISPLSSFSP